MFVKKDVYLASYPRSGNTWLRVLMAYLYFDEPIINSLIDLQSYIPDEHFKHEKINETRKINNKFRIIKTHTEYRSKIYKKSIYIYRNPIDVAWSYYNFLKDTHKLNNNRVDFFVNDFLEGNVPFGNWENHVKNWLQHDNVFVFSYEELAANTYDTIEQINKFIQVAVPDSKIEQAITTVTPELVKKITDDEVFYGTNKPDFVTSPLKKNSEEKKIFFSLYADQIKDNIKIYDFKDKRLII